MGWLSKIQHEATNQIPEEIIMKWLDGIKLVFGAGLASGIFVVVLAIGAALS